MQTELAMKQADPDHEFHETPSTTHNLTRAPSSWHKDSGNMMANTSAMTKRILVKMEESDVG
eukprot:scaffold67_cov139-Amphora_coffeaeformis.AAC.2